VIFASAIVVGADAGRLNYRDRGCMDTERARQLLTRERERIEHALVGRRWVDVGELSDQDEPADRGSELFQDELDESLLTALRNELAAVERAEARLAAGTYGRSVASGQQIPEERLEAFPTAELTLEEEQRIERTQRTD
jgi:DnaK suppressor protein